MVSGESGKRLRLGDGRELKLIAGSDGPIVVVREKDKKPVLRASCIHTVHRCRTIRWNECDPGLDRHHDGRTSQVAFSAMAHGS